MFVISFLRFEFLFIIAIEIDTEVQLKKECNKNRKI